MKYIDAEKLYEYLEQVSEFYPRYADNFLDNAVINVIKGIKTFIASLQQEQPEVDLEKEILDWIGDEDSCKNGEWTWYECNKMLRHFYELGKKMKQKPAEWSEEDEHYFQNLIMAVDSTFSDGNTKNWLQNRLKSLRPQPRKEQPDIIDYICLCAGIPAPFMDGNQWCILKGDNIQVGVVGFGDTKDDALIDFIKDIPLQHEPAKGIDGVVHHYLNTHWIVTDKKQLATALKVFPEGAEVELFIFAKKEGAK